MNLFVLDSDHTQNAKCHCDRHCVKMILESAQLLCTALWDQNIVAPYRSTHKNHPCAIWTRETESNFDWCTDYALSLCDEYFFRYDKIHKSLDVILKCRELKSLMSFSKTGLTPFALAMPDQYKTSDAVESYRNYYNGDKRHLFSWSRRPVPDWIIV